MFRIAHGQQRQDLTGTRSIANVLGVGRPSELALQKILQLIIDDSRSSKPEPLRVVIFLYGGWSGMDRSEANHFIDELLETSAIAFGVRDRRSPHIWFLIGEQKEVAHYIATETGGQYFEATPDTYSRALQEILLPEQCTNLRIWRRFFSEDVKKNHLETLEMLF